MHSPCTIKRNTTCSVISTSTVNSLNMEKQFVNKKFRYVFWGAQSVQGGFWFQSKSGLNMVTAATSLPTVLNLVARAELAASLEKRTSSIVRCAASTRLVLTLARCTVAPSWFLVTRALKFAAFPRVLNRSRADFANCVALIQVLHSLLFYKTQNIATRQLWKLLEPASRPDAAVILRLIAEFLSACAKC